MSIDEPEATHEAEMMADPADETEVAAPAEPAASAVSEASPRPELSRGAIFTLVSSFMGILAQLWLAGLGAVILFGPTDPTDPAGIGGLLTWCTVATLFLAATTVTLTFMARSPQPDSSFTRRIIGHPLARLIAIVFTFGASLIGIAVALQIITDLGHEVLDPTLEIVGIWAMLVSWALFNWGYARIYFSRYHQAKEPPLIFPGTPDPKLVDFAYLAFTNATNFSVSDVQVTSTQLRWTVVWHTTIAFFFNALIIGLIINVLANGKLFGAIFD